MMTKRATLITVCLALTLFGLANAHENPGKNEKTGGDTLVPFFVTTITDPLTHDELQSALSYLGLQLARFRYEAPHKHRLRLFVQQFVEGKSKGDLPGGSFYLEAGQHTLILFKHRKANAVSLAAECEGTCYPIEDISTESFSYTTSTYLSDTQLIKGARVPLWVFAANHQGEESTGVRSTDKVDDIKSGYDLVVIIAVELEE